MNSEESMNIKIKLELHEEITCDDNEGELMDASFSDGTVKLEDELKEELREELANEIDDNTKYFCELCKSYFPNLSSLQDHMHNHDNCEDIDTKSSKDSKNVDAMKSTDVKEESGEGKHREKPHDKQKEKCNEKKTKRKRQRAEEKDDRINLENDVSENDEHELVNLIMKDHIILRKKHHDVDKASFKIVKEETEDINENDNEELVNLIMKDHIILRTNHHDGNITKMKTEASEETSRNSMCEKSNVNAETSDGNNQIDNELSETRQDTVINVVGDAHGDSYMENATKCSNNTKRRKKLVSKELATENIPPQSPHMPNQKFQCELCKNKYVNKETLEMHMADHPKYICYYCDKVWYRKFDLEVHIKHIHLKLRYRCKKCGNEYANLYTHTKRCNKNIPLQSPHMPNQKFDCNICSRSFETSKKLQNHKYTSHRRPSAFCDVCQKKFSSKQVLNEHMKRVHLGIKMEYKCKFCGKSYSYKSGLCHHTNKCSKNKNKTLKLPPQSPHIPNQKFDCNVCSRSFETSKKLQNHKYTSHRRRPSAFCDVCQKKFCSKRYLNEHVKRVHLGIKVGCECKFCGKRYSYKSSLGRHTNECPKNKNKTLKFKCELCGMKYMNQKTLQMHMADHRKYICDYCDKLCYARYRLVRHIKKCGKEYANLYEHMKPCNKNIPPQSPHMPNQFDCNVCSRSFDTSKKLQRHKYRSHGPSAFCDVCQKKYSNKATLDRHVKRVHLGVKQKYICDYCDKLCYLKYDIESHIKCVHLKVRYRCKKCGNEYADLNQHMKRCHKNIPLQSPHMPNQFDCNVCSRSFDTSRILQRHKYISHRLSAFCDVCQKNFSSKRYLNEHVKRVHLGIKMEYKCKFCGKDYSYKSDLCHHTNKCSKNKTLKFKCELCGYKYVNQKPLQIHMADHPKYICDYCDKLCYLKYDLEKHIKCVHLKVRYRCKKCGNEYAKLNAHVKRCNKNIK